MNTSPFRALAAALLVAAALTAAAADRRTEELMRKSGLWIQLGQVQSQMVGGAQQAQDMGSGAERLDDADFAKLKASMNLAFAPEKLQKAMSREMESLLSAEDEAEVLKWLSSDLGKRITKIEEESGELEKSMAIERAAPAHFATVPKERVEKYRRMVKAIRMGEVTASMVINMTTAIGFGMAMGNPSADAAAVANAMRARMEPQREQMAAEFDARSLQTFAYIYREIGDADLDRYVAFAESPVGKRYHDASTRGMDKVIARASLDVGREFDILKREPSTRS